jgi:hypothetical protein
MVSPAQYARMRQRMAEKADTVAPRYDSPQEMLRAHLDESPQYEVLTPEGNDD